MHKAVTGRYAARVIQGGNRDGERRAGPSSCPESSHPGGYAAKWLRRYCLPLFSVNQMFLLTSVASRAGSCWPWDVVFLERCILEIWPMRLPLYSLNHNVPSVFGTIGKARSAHWGAETVLGNAVGRDPANRSTERREPERAVRARSDTKRVERFAERCL